MKNLHIPLFLILIISVLTTACNKEEGGVTPNTMRLIDKVSVSDGTFSQYTYDANGRCIRVDGEAFYFTYAYSNSTVTETFVPNSGTSSVYTYLLNTQGLVEKRTYIIGSYTYESLYEYDAKGFRLKRTYQSKLTSSTSAPTVSLIIQWNHDTDGDILSIKSTAFSSPSANNYTTTYSVDKKNYATIGNEFAGLKWQGRYSTHATTNYIHKPNSGAIETVNIVNTYDAKGYIIQRVSNSSVSGSITYTYTYK
jgi:hypothetical protein